MKSAALYHGLTLVAIDVLKQSQKGLEESTPEGGITAQTAEKIGAKATEPTIPSDWQDL